MVTATASSRPERAGFEIRLAKVDRPRRIDLHIDYFGEAPPAELLERTGRSSPVMVSGRGRHHHRRPSPPARVSDG